MIAALVFALLLQQTPSIDYVRAHAEQRLKPVRISESISIDGLLNEPGWTNAAVAGGFTQSEPAEGVPPSEQTEVKVMYDGDNLYFGVVAHDREPKKVIVSDLKKDFEKNQGDNVEIVLDTFHDGRNGYMFATNAAGAKWDAQMGNEGREMNSSWDGVWFAKARVVDDGWVAEIAVPFKTLKFRDAEIQSWGLNIRRTIRRRNEEDYWSPLPRIYNLERVSYAGTLEGLEGIKPGLNLKLKPYVISSLSRNTAAKIKRDGDMGFDAKYGITSGLTWDFTYNTDFSQVEADTQQINLTRFSLFFPEKRDFFLENSGVFVFGNNEGRGPIGYNPQNGPPGGSGTTGGGRLNNVSSDLILFFSRRIGLSDEGQAIPILGGTRLTGRVGRFEVGLLNIQQKKDGALPSTNFGVVRLKRNILANSDIGFMAVNKDQSGSMYNRAYGVDANFRLRQNYYLNGYVANTASPLTKGKGKTGAGRVSGGYKVNLWDVRTSYIQIAPNFRDEVGYLPRVGIKNQNNHIGFHIRPERFKRWLREIGPHVATEYNVGPDGRLDTRYMDYHLRFSFQDGAGGEIGVNPSYERVTKPFTISSFQVPNGSYGNDEWFVSGNTNTSRSVSVNGRWGTGPFYIGHRKSYQAGTILRAGHQFNTQVSYTRNNIDLPSRSLSTNLASIRLNYAFSTIMFMNALVQYNSDAHQVNSNIRFNIIHRPLSDIFIVYNERRDSVTHGLLDRALIGKVTYMISR